MSFEDARETIRAALEDGSTELDLSNNQLTSVPPELAQLTRLTQLSLFNNQLTSVPPELAQLTRLTTLYLHNNQLTSVPPELAQLTRLTQLDLDNNQFTSVPPELAQLTPLTQLSLSFNQLTSVPPELAQLTRLTRLYLHSNQLTSVPPELAQLTRLTRLHLYGNQLTSVPPELAQLTRLTRLDLDRNQLRWLPAELSQLTGLTEVETSDTYRTGEGLLNIAGNPFPQDLIDAANQGIDHLWDYLATNQPPPPTEPDPPEPQPDEPPTDPKPPATPPPRTAVATLTGDAVTITRAALENPLTLINRYLDDTTTPLDPASEDRLRRAAAVINLELGAIEPDRFIVERAIAKIVGKLLEIGRVGPGARSLLQHHLGVESDDLVDRIVTLLQKVAEVIAEQWGRLDNDDPGAPIVEADNLSKQVIAELREGLAKSERFLKLMELQPGPPELDPELRAALLRDQIVIQLAQAISQFGEHWVPAERP